LDNDDDIMPDFISTLIRPLITLLVFVTIGLLGRKAGIISDRLQQHLTRLVMNFLLPVMLFMAGFASDPTSLARESGLAFLGGLVLPLLGYGAGALVTRIARLPRRQASVVRVDTAFCNTGFVGLPLCAALWGPQGALLAAVYDQAVTLSSLTLAPLDYGHQDGRRPWRSLLLSPLLWSLALGVTCGLAGWTLPPWARRPLDLVTSATLPMSLILVGSLALPDRLERALARPLATLVGSRLLLAPLVTLAAVSLLDLRGVLAGILVLQTAMPASVMVTVMAKEYGADADLAGAGALVTVILSAVTLPAMVALVHLLRA